MKQGTSGTYGAESLPNIKGNTDNWIVNAGDSSGVGAISVYTRYAIGSNNIGLYANANTGRIDLYLDASLSSSVYQNNAKVNPDNAEIMYCIKY